ncbi:hypothetical protein [Rhodoflexus caldus]|nr:hypothetical protein [Rhodoflexus caldus]
MDTYQLKEYGITALIALVAALLFILLAKPLGYARWVNSQFQA